MKRSLNPLSLAILGLLREQPRHAYDMYQTLKVRGRDRILRIKPGTLYHAVSRLQEQGLIEEEATERDGNRPERTVYGLTSQGHQVLVEDISSMLGSPDASPLDYAVALSEAHNLDQAAVVARVPERIEALRRRLEELAGFVAMAEAKPAPPAVYVDLTYQQHLITAEIQWLETLLHDTITGRVDFNFYGAVTPERTICGTD